MKTASDSGDGPPPSKRGRFLSGLKVAAAILTVVVGALQWRAQVDGVAAQREVGRPASQEIPPAARIGLAQLMRPTLESGRRPSLDDPEIAHFMAAQQLAPESVRNFLTELTARARTAAEAIARGRKAGDAGETAAAYDAFTKATDEDPTNAYAWANLGAAAELLHKPLEARRAYERALAIDSANWLAHYNLGCHLARNHQHDAAIDEIARAVELFRGVARTPGEAASVMRQIRADDALKDLHDDPRFQKLLD
ncbi:MAG TPA: tetratricopeptide repeat protein [Thermoanaerobaculia bacterium]|nr:tetratricopeptide repeat protein [Thermoanaerobaculia bacterium]